MNRIWLWCITMICLDTWILVQFVSDISSWRTLLAWLVAHIFACLFFSIVFSKALCAESLDRGVKLTVITYCVSICLPILGMVGILVLIAPSLVVGSGWLFPAQTGQKDGPRSLLGHLINATVEKYNRMHKLPIGRHSQHEIGVVRRESMAYKASAMTAEVQFWTANKTVLKTARAVNEPITGVVCSVAPEMCGVRGISASPLVANVAVKVPGSTW